MSKNGGLGLLFYLTPVSRQHTENSGKLNNDNLDVTSWILLGVQTTWYHSLQFIFFDACSDFLKKNKNCARNLEKTRCKKLINGQTLCQRQLKQFYHGQRQNSIVKHGVIWLLFSSTPWECFFFILYCFSENLFLHIGVTSHGKYTFCTGDLSVAPHRCKSAKSHPPPLPPMVSPEIRTEDQHFSANQ